MLFAMSATDRVDAGSLRADTRPEHLEHLKRMGAKVAFAGPYLAADGKTPVGSLVIFEATDQAAAEAIAQADPFCKAGLFSSISVTPFRVTLQNLPLTGL